MTTTPLTQTEREKLTRRAEARRLLRWRYDILAFFEEALDFHAWKGPPGKDGQAEVARSFQDRPWVAVKSGHKVGKSTVFSACALWWCVTQPGAPRFVATAPTNRQLREVVWRETRRLYASAKVPLGGSLAANVDRGIQWPNGAQFIGVSAKNTEAFAGFSGQMAVGVDEASGLNEQIYTSVFGNLSGGGKLLLTGNPTQNVGTFYDAFHSKREEWRLHTISSMDTPNFHGGRVPFLAEPVAIGKLIAQFGAGSPRDKVRIRGEFADLSTDTVIPLGIVDLALARWRHAVDVDLRTGAEPPDPLRTHQAPLILGVDVARFGDDDSVIAIRRGPFLRIEHVVNGQDTFQIAHKVREIAGRYRRTGEHPPVANVDVGGVGAGVVDTLVRHESDVRVVGINAGAAAQNRAIGSGLGYFNFRTELWFRGAEFLRDMGALCSDSVLETELMAPRYGYDASGRYKVELKDETKKRIQRSPDRADAALLTLVEPTQRRGGEASAGKRR